MIYELKVTLTDVGVPVWRKIQLASNTTFHELHLLMQVLFDWQDSHLHTFIVNKTNGKSVDEIEISLKEMDDFFSVSPQMDKGDEKKEKLEDWLIKEKDSVIYTYDFGDNWQHEIVLLQKLDKEKDVLYPICTAAKNLAPPEDSRREVIMGEVELTYSNSEKLKKEMNEDIIYWIDDSFLSVTQPEHDYWPETLLMAKQLQQKEPWSLLSDENIFAFVDPVSEKHLFCSIIGNAKEMFGLTVYVGMDGFFALMDILTNKREEFDIIQRQHSLLVSFEDRTDLHKSEYDLIKTYDIPFRGRKAWPSFVSFKPGHYPWIMENEEARTILVAMEETIALYADVKKGLTLPNLLKDGKLLVRNASKRQIENNILDLEEVLDSDEGVALTISEIELKRVSKIKKPLPVTIEFTMTYVNMPIEMERGERPIFPLTTIVADHDEDIILHHEMYEQTMDATIAQREFINVLHNLKGIPQTFLTDDRTYYYISSLLDELNVHVEIVDELPVVETILEGLHGYLSQENDFN